VAYEGHDMRQLLIPASKPGGGGTLNLAFLDRVLADLALHAADYPPQFDSPEDMQRARKDARTLIGMFHQAFGAAPPQGLLLRMAMLGTYGHNLDVPEAAAFAQNHFQKLLATDAGHATGNYQYGAFLAATGRPRESLPYLNKARDQGVTPALYSIGMAQLSLGDQKSALVSLDEYLKRNPTDQRVRMLADAIRSGKVKIQTKQGG
jgi:tetratricopeptide (TPR) repeat protein